jgi:hypothetical protein
VFDPFIGHAVALQESDIADLALKAETAGRRSAALHAMLRSTKAANKRAIQEHSQVGAACHAPSQVKIATGIACTFLFLPPSV